MNLLLFILGSLMFKIDTYKIGVFYHCMMKKQENKQHKCLNIINYSLHLYITYVEPEYYFIKNNSKHKYLNLILTCLS